MYERSSSLVLRWLKVPPEPQPPQGDPASLRVFRAGKSYFNLRLAGWGFAQLIAFAGIVFWIVVFIDIEAGVKTQRLNHQAVIKPTDARHFDEYVKQVVESAATEDEAATSPQPKPAEHAPAAPAQTTGDNVAAAVPPAKESSASAAAADQTVKSSDAATKPAKGKRSNRVRITGWGGFKRLLVNVALLAPPWAFPIFWALKIIGILVYLIQLPLTYAVRRLDYEMRWYMVTDRSLRIRHGVWKIQESTMSFANIQQVVVTQNPIQQLLGLANVRVQSAGGGGGGDEHKHGDEDMHLGVFHGVTNATEIRDLILERLRRFRDSGLGDPEELRRAALAPTPASSASGAMSAATASVPITASPELLAAARELAAEARALRVALS
jgi:hypothetical protein